MRILYIADGHSPTTLSWLEYWMSSGDDVHLVSTYPCKPLTCLASTHNIPIALSSLSAKSRSVNMGRIPSRLREVLRTLRYFYVPASLPYNQRKFKKIVDTIQPDIIHAFRIPFEGMLSYCLPKDIPYVVSTWGNDITLHAYGSLFMSSLTRRVLRRADALISDTKRDIRLAHAWGLRMNVPTVIIPGAGGIRLDKIRQDAEEAVIPGENTNPPLIVNSRGRRPGSIRQDLFLQAIPKILAVIPKANFICTSLDHDAASKNLISSLGIEDRVKLWPHLTQPQLWKLFSKAQIFVSPSIHDGTPNSLLEAMYFGCLPVVGNIDSLREWISDGFNGILINANDIDEIAKGIIRSICEPALQIQAAEVNAELIAERADYWRNMMLVRDFYLEVIHQESH